jgi:hypothetical protein
MRRVMVKIPVILLSSLLLLSCTKDNELSQENSFDPVKNVKVSPMAKDSTQLDSLKKWEYL